MDTLRLLAALQAIYYILTGVWPILHMRSFLAVTGPKTDLWLVKTVGILIAVIGMTIGAAAWGDRIDLEIFLLAAGSALALACVDIVYVAKRVIARIYLLDAVPELILVALWIAGWTSRGG